MIQPGDLLNFREDVQLCIGRNKLGYLLLVQYYPREEDNPLDLIDKFFMILTKQPRRVVIINTNSSKNKKEEFLEEMKLGHYEGWCDGLVDFQGIFDIYYDRIVKKNEILGTRYMEFLGKLIVFMFEGEVPTKLSKLLEKQSGLQLYIDAFSAGHYMN